MPAVNDQTATDAFAEMIDEMIDDTGRDVTVEPAESAGWMVDSSLLVTDEESGETYLVTVKRVL